MSVRTLISNLLMKLTDIETSTSELSATDPWNYCLAQQLDNPGLNNPAREPSALQRRVMAAFPKLTTAEAEAILQQLEPLYKLAYDLGSLVNCQQLTEQAASTRLKEAFTQINADNLQKLMLQSLVNTR